MRIAVSNPDNIGDFILRQPMLAAFLEAGHEVLLIVRDFVGPLATHLFPTAHVLRCVGNPYERDFSLTSGLGQEMLRDVKTFAPDLFVVAPYQYTQLEEVIAAELPGVDCIGVSGYLFQTRPDITAVSAIRFTTRVSVDRESAELDKNSSLCAAVLGHGVNLSPPKIEAGPVALSDAAVRLKELGLEGRPFWAVCAGDAPGKSVRNWRMDQWAELCSGLVGKTGVTLVFVGTPEEHSSTLEIQLKMGDAGLRTASMTVEPLKLNTLVGVLQLAEGYIGKDTGPMHIAAALGKPVLTVFGGGDWPRFVPAPVSGAIFTVEVPCVGCGWACHLSRSHCVKDIPVAVVAATGEAMVLGKMADFSVNVLKPDPILNASILRELLASVRSQQREVASERANFLQWHDDRVSEIGQLREQLATAARNSASLEAQAAAAVSAQAALEEERSVLQAQRSKLEAQCSALESECSGLTGRLHTATAALEFEKRLADASIRQTTDAQIAMERRLERFRQVVVRKITDARVKAGALRTANALLESAAAQAAEDGAAWKSRGEEAVAELALMRERLEETTIRAASLQAQADTGESRYLGILADQEQILKRKSMELTSALTLIPDLREELAALTADLGASEDRVRKLEGGMEARTQRIVQLEASYEESERGIANTRGLLSQAEERLQVLAADHAARLVVIEALVKDLEAAAADRAAKAMRVESLQGELEVIERDRAERLRLIEDISKQLAESEFDRAERLRLIEDISKRLVDSERDRAERLRLIEDISKQLAESEFDRAERLRVIEDLSTRLAESDEDRNRRLLLIQQLSAELATVETDRKLRGEQIAKLHEHSTSLQQELTALRNLLPYRILKQLHIF
jgi:ADP-heptose:LPS heptosyltransferase